MDFIKSYLDYTRETESPYIYHRWCCIVTIGALLSRNFYLPFGRQRVFPNLYTMLIGDAGARKSTAIKTAKGLLTASGYTTIAASKTRIEKFLIDLEGLTTEEESGIADTKANSKVYDRVLAANLWGDSGEFQEPRESYIMADEWSVFAGVGNLDMYDVLGDLWDWDDKNLNFTHRLKNSKSVSIFQPTISILGGSNLTNFIRAFPPETLEHGILSRMVIIGGERSGRKYTIPPSPTETETAAIVATMRQIREFRGEAKLDEEAYGILDRLYNGWTEIADTRFRSYNNRRYTQLLKLCVIISASRATREIDSEIVITANTILSAAEAVMPKTLGEFGKSKHSDVANKIMEFLYSVNRPASVKQLWALVHQDLEKPQLLQEILSSLMIADRVQNIKDKGYLPKRKVTEKQQFVDWNILTEEERETVS